MKIEYTEREKMLLKVHSEITAKEIIKRDRKIGILETLLSGALAVILGLLFYIAIFC